MGFGATEKGLRKGPWTHEEDHLLSEYVSLHGDCSWNSVARLAGLNRSGKSCRLRWVNYLKPGLKKGRLTPQEEGIIFELHAVLGNKWSTIAKYLPGRTDSEIKNFWRTRFKNKEKPSFKKSEKRKTQGQKQIKQGQQGEKQLQECNMKSKTEIEQTEAQEKKQEMTFMSPPLEDQEIYPSWSDMLGYEGILVNLWNLDEQPQGHRADNLNQFSDYAMLNQAIIGGDPDKLVAQNQDRTFSFDDVFNNLRFEKYMFG